jgi:hypothetical protein
MEFNRNQYFMAGLVLLLLGIQFRVVDTFVLSQPVTLFLAEKTGKLTAEQVASIKQMNDNPTALGKKPVEEATQKKVRPPRWIGWSLISFGSVLILHSLAMKKPGG